MYANLSEDLSNPEFKWEITKLNNQTYYKGINFCNLWDNPFNATTEILNTTDIYDIQSTQQVDTIRLPYVNSGATDAIAYYTQFVDLAMNYDCHSKILFEWPSSQPTNCPYVTGPNTTFYEGRCRPWYTGTFNSSGQTVFNDPYYGQNG